MNKKQKERAEIELQLSRVLQTPSERGARSRGLLDDYRSPTRFVIHESVTPSLIDTEDTAHTIVVPLSPSRTKNVPHTFTEPGPVQNVPGTKNVPLPQKSTKKGFLKLTNHYIYDLVPTLKPTDSVVLLYLVARTHGFNQDEVRVSLDTIANACNIHRNQARISARRLHAKKHILIVGSDSQDPDISRRGLIIKMLLPRATGTENVSGTENVPRTKNIPNKEKAFKRKDIKGNTPKITRLTPEDKEETIEMIAELITKSGYSFEQAEAQFGGNLTAEDWTAIRARVEGQGTTA